MNKIGLSLGLAAVAALGGCVAPTGPVEVTRFHVPDTAGLGKGTISVEPAAGQDGASLEWQTYQAAVRRQLALQGYAEAPSGQGAQVAELRLARGSFQPDRARSPVSVGIGGSTGSYGSGLGIGIGLNLSGPPPEMTATRLAVTIRERTGTTPLWEGRADFSARSSSPLAGTQLGAPKLAAALFQGFPGNSGETITVK
jgi:hypothetical protein